MLLDTRYAHVEKTQRLAESKFERRQFVYVDRQ